MSNLITRTTELAMSVTLAYIKEGDTVIDATCGTGQDTAVLARAAGESGKVYAFDIQEQALKLTEERLRLQSAETMQAVQSAQTEHTAQSAQTEQATQTMQVEHTAQIAQTEQATQTMQAVQSAQTENTAQSEQAEYSAQSAQTEPTGGLAEVRLIHGSFTTMGEHVQEGSAAAVVFNLGYLPGGDHSITTTADETLAGLDAALKAIRPGGVVTVVLYDGHEAGKEEKRRVLGWAETLDSGRYHVAYVIFPNQKNCPPEILWITRKKARV